MGSTHWVRSYLTNDVCCKHCEPLVSTVHLWKYQKIRVYSNVYNRSSMKLTDLKVEEKVIN